MATTKHINNGDTKSTSAPTNSAAQSKSVSAGSNSHNLLMQRLSDKPPEGYPVNWRQTLRPVSEPPSSHDFRRDEKVWATLTGEFLDGNIY